MKKTIKTFVGRLRDAWSIIRGRNQLLIRHDEDASMQDAYRTSGILSGTCWFRINDNVDYFSRVDMLFDLLNDTNSIMLLTKDADGTLTYCYDCKTEEDFNDLISMEVK